VIGVAHVFAVRGDFEGVKADGECALHRVLAAGNRQCRCGGSRRAETKLVEVCDDFGNVRGVRAEALLELRRSEELVKFGVSGRVDGGEKFFSFVAVAHAKRDGDGELCLRKERSAINRFGSIASRIGKCDPTLNGGIGLGEHNGNTSQQDKARHKHPYGYFQGVPPREKIYRAEIIFGSRTTATDTLNGGDSVGECLHPDLVNCQLDISNEGGVFLDLIRFLRPIMWSGEG
jgi:hypothetical protein